MRKLRSGARRNWASVLWPALGVLALLCGATSGARAQDKVIDYAQQARRIAAITGEQVKVKKINDPIAGSIWIYDLETVKAKVLKLLPDNQTIEVRGNIGRFMGNKGRYSFRTFDGSDIQVIGDYPDVAGGYTTWIITARVVKQSNGTFVLAERKKVRPGNQPPPPPPSGGHVKNGVTNSAASNNVNPPAGNVITEPPPTPTRAWYQEPMILLGGLLILAALATLGALLAKNSGEQKRRAEAERRQREMADQRAREESARQAALQLEMQRGRDSTVASAPGAAAPPPAPDKTLVSVGTLKALSGPHAGDSFPLVIGENRIGRSAENGIKLDRDKEVSGNHASLVVSHGGGPVVFKDASSNGSRVDGQSVHHNQVNLSPNAKVEVGASTLQLSMRNSGAPSTPPVATPIASGRGGDTVVVGAPASSASTPAASSTMLGYTAALEIVDGPDKGKPLFTLTKKKIAIGRENADLLLSDPTVSSSHATLSMDGGRFLLSDNNSTNGTRLNDTPVDATGRELKEGDRIALGKGATVLVFHRYS